MRTLTTAVLALLALSGTAAAQDMPAFSKDTFPLELAQRPLLLPAGMLEVRGGLMSDLVGEITDDTRVRGRFDAVYAPMVRAQLGFEIDLMVFPTDVFEVRDINGWAEYNLFPTFSFRIGGYLEVPQTEVDPVTGEMELGDAEAGVRAGFPIKVHLGKKLAVTANPRYGVLLAGGEQQDLDLPFSIQLAPIRHVSLYFASGVRVEDVANFDAEKPNVNLFMPVVVGGIITPGNLLDLGADLRLTDLTDEEGRQERWVFVYMTLRR